MNNYKVSFLCIFIYLLIVSCEGPVGPSGEDGVANIVTKVYTFTSLDVTSTISSAQIEQSIPEITSSVVASGTVIVEWKNPTSTTNPNAWQQLPITIPIDLDDAYINVDVTHLLTYSYTEGELKIGQTCSNNDDLTASYQKSIMGYFLGPYKVSIFTPPTN